MRFMTLVRSNETQGPAPKGLEDAIGRMIEEGFKNGTLVEAGGLHPANAARVRLSRGKVTVTDGPFAEAKEVIGGYAVFELPTLEAAIAKGREFMDAHRLHWPGWEGETEVRQLFGGA